MADKGVQPVLGGSHLDYGTLSGREIDGLGTPVAVVTGLQVDTFFDDIVKDRADDVERRVDRRAGVEHEQTHVFAGRDLDRVVGILRCHPVEHHEVGSGRRLIGLLVRRRFALRAQVPVILDQEELVVDRLQPACRFDDDHPEHAVGDVVQGRGGAAVVHPHAGVVGGELVDQCFPWGDRAHLVVHRHLRGVEVDRVRDRRLGWIHQIDSDGVADPGSQHRTGNLTVERPNELFVALGDGHQLLLDDHLDHDQIATACRAAGHARDTIALTSSRCPWITQLVWRRTRVGLDRCRRGASAANRRVAAGADRLGRSS